MSNLEDLIGSAVIAELAGVSASTVRCWPDRHDDYPDPVATVGRTSLWSRAAVVTWLEATGRLSDDEKGKK